MATLLPVLRDCLNLKIEEKPELWGILKNFKNILIEVRFIDQPLNDYCLFFQIDGDGLLKSTGVKDKSKINSNVIEKFVQEPDVTISVDNSYLKQIGEEFVGWSLDFSKKDPPDSNIFTNGLKIEGEASTIQGLAPLLIIIVKDLSPLAALIKKSPINFAIQHVVEHFLYKEELVVLSGEFEFFTKNIRGLRNDIERAKKKLEILGQRS